MGLLSAEDGPLDAEMVFRKLSTGPLRINRSTVYRALRRLEDEGAVLIVDLGARRGYRDARTPGTLSIVKHRTHSPGGERLDLIAQEVKSLFRAHGYRLHGHFEIFVAPLVAEGGAAEEG